MAPDDGTPKGQTPAAAMPVETAPIIPGPSEPVAEPAAPADAPPAQKAAAPAVADEWTPERVNQELDRAEALATNYVRLGLYTVPTTDLNHMGERVGSILDHLRATHGPDAHKQPAYARGATLVAVLFQGIKDRETAEKMVGLPAVLARAEAAEKGLEANEERLHTAAVTLADLQHRLGNGFPEEAYAQNYVPKRDYLDASARAERLAARVDVLQGQVDALQERAGVYEVMLGPDFQRTAGEKGYIPESDAGTYAQRNFGMVPGSELEAQRTAANRLQADLRGATSKYERALARAEKAEAKLKAAAGARTGGRKK
jgi:hypothetical protein